MKKLMMVLTMAVAAAMSAWATTESANGYTWTYTASDGKATITAVSPEPSGDVKIPSSFNRGLARVTAIGESVFSGCGDMTYVTLPEKLEHIGPYAFKNCTGLVVLQLPPTVKYIDYQAFCDCTGLLSVIFGTSSAMSVLDIEDDAFYGCKNLTGVYINYPDLSKWCESKFYNEYSNPIYYAEQLHCPGAALVTTIDVPDGVKYIGDYAFQWCDAATNAVIAASVESIGDGAFYGCYALTDVKFPGASRLTSIGDRAFGWLGLLDSMPIPPGVTSIGKGAFFSSDNMLWVDIPESVTSIGKDAFDECYGLKYVYVDFGETARVKKMIEDSGKDTSDIIFQESDLSYVNLRFDANGGKMSYGSAELRLKVARNKPIGDNMPTPTWTGHEFLGWFTEKTGGTQLTPSDVMTGDVTLYYAHWKLKQYKLSYSANGGTVSPAYKMVDYCATYGTLPTPTWGGHTFNGWFTAKTGGTKVTSSTKCVGNATIYAQWKVNQYKLSYSANGGTVSPAYKMVNYCATYGELPTPTWGGHTFNGWYTAKTGGTKVTSSTKCTGNATVYAQWTIKQYKLSYSANGGTVSPASKMVNYCATYGELPTPTWGGHTFNGWFTAKTGGTKVTSSTKCTGNATIYAQWTVKQYTVTFNANGGTVTPASQKVNYCATYTLPTPSWSGHTFKGWYTAASGGTKVTSPAKCTGNVTLYAHW